MNLDIKETLINLGKNIKLYRVNSGLSQQDVADKTGISVRSISRFEQGESIQMDNFLKILKVLNLSDNIQLLVPDQTKRPSYYLTQNTASNKRVKKSKNNNSNFKWGE